MPCVSFPGLEPSVQHYPFKEWDITGQDLLDLSPQHLDTLGVKSIGHQEVILEAVEQLCALVRSCLLLYQGIVVKAHLRPGSH